jgi:uncharacterized protein
MSIHPRRVRLGGRECAAILQTPDGGAAPSKGVLMCRPIGQESVRANAMFRVLSERLVREGFAVLRFDYHGTGDSPGAEKDQDFCSFIEDIIAAHEVLCGEGIGRTAWFGMRLGANAASEAARLVSEAPAQLILWEPVINGSAYLQSLLTAHRNELMREFGGLAWQRLIAKHKASEPLLPGDVLGFNYGDALVKQIGEIEQLNIRPALRRAIRTVCALRQEDRGYAEQLPASDLLRVQIVQAQTDWLSSQAMGSAIAPPDAVKALLDALGP